MLTVCLEKMRMSIGIDWIEDLFEELERIPDGVRFSLEDLLEQVYIEDEFEHVYFIQMIYDEALDQEGVDELYRRLNDRRVPVRDQYAPRQKDLSQWIRSFCFTQQMP